ncbi:TPA: hypothetical protein EYP70_01995, partial [Candidatus Bathyarchaeota archaeon]|nr:hypothetical protein [Candidatus Bathyarchaeota archaeon]
MKKPSRIFMKKHPFDKLTKQIKANKYIPIARYRSHPLDDKYLLHPGLLPVQSIPEIIFSLTGERVRIFVFIKKYQNRQMEFHEEFRDIWNIEGVRKNWDVFEMIKDRKFLKNKEDLLNEFFYTEEVFFDGGKDVFKSLKRLYLIYTSLSVIVLLSGLALRFIYMSWTLLFASIFLYMYVSSINTPHPAKPLKLSTLFLIGGGVVFFSFLPFEPLSIIIVFMVSFVARQGLFAMLVSILDRQLIDKYTDYPLSKAIRKIFDDIYSLINKGKFKEARLLTKAIFETPAETEAKEMLSMGAITDILFESEFRRINIYELRALGYDLEFLSIISKLSSNKDGGEHLFFTLPLLVFGTNQLSPVIEMINDFISTHPVVTAFIFILIGFAIGMLIRYFKGLSFPEHAREEVVNRQEALERMISLIKQTQRELPQLRGRLLSFTQRESIAFRSMILKVQDGKLVVFDNVDKGIAKVRKILTEAKEDLKIAEKQIPYMMKEARQMRIETGQKFPTIMMKIVESRDDLEKVGKALEEVESVVKQLEGTPEEARGPPRIDLVERDLKAIESALNNVDSAIGDAKLTLPRKLAMPASIVLTPFGGEAKEGSLDRLQKALEELEDALWQLHAAMFYLNKDGGNLFLSLIGSLFFLPNLFNELFTKSLSEWIGLGPGEKKRYFKTAIFEAQIYKIAPLWAFISAIPYIGLIVIFYPPQAVWGYIWFLAFAFPFGWSVGMLVKCIRGNKEELAKLISYLAPQDELEKADLLIILGNDDLGVIEEAIEVANNWVDYVIVSGGRGRLTEKLIKNIENSKYKEILKGKNLD